MIASIVRNDRPLIIYHANCADGFGAAYAAWSVFGEGAEYYPAVHNDPAPDVAGRLVAILDFSYPRATLLSMREAARLVLILDHHKTADEDLHPHFDVLVRLHRDRTTWADFVALASHYELIVRTPPPVYALIDMHRSGAGIAWDFFHPVAPRPRLIEHIEDRDLWRFNLPGTREIQAALFSYPYDFNVWDRLMRGPLEQLQADGCAIERKHHKDVAELVRVLRQRMVIGGYWVWAANLPYTMTSDAGMLMCKGEQFAACYWDTPDGRVFSLRSEDGGIDVSAVARGYGGGGHKHAAGFRLPHGASL